LWKYAKSDEVATLSIHCNPGGKEESANCVDRIRGVKFRSFQPPPIGDVCPTCELVVFNQVMTFFDAIPDDAHAVKCELAAEVLRSSGALRLRVSGKSMLPAIWPGDTLLIERVESHTVSEGDIVLFGRDRRLVVHRVARRIETPAESGIVTRGDAMPEPDPAVPEGDLLGKVSIISRNGNLIAPRKTPRWTERAVAVLVRRSDIAARVVVGIRGLRQIFRNWAIPCQH
jgi:signal peptidase I